MKKALLVAETVISFPFFLLSWMACAVWFAMRAGYLLASSDSEDKRALLDEMFKKSGD